MNISGSAISLAQQYLWRNNLQRLGSNFPFLKFAAVSISYLGRCFAERWILLIATPTSSEQR